MKIRVLTVKGQPEFEAATKKAGDIDKIVLSRHGTQPDGKPHNWRGTVERS